MSAKSVPDALMEKEKPYTKTGMSIKDNSSKESVPATANYPMQTATDMSAVL